MRLDRWLSITEPGLQARSLRLSKESARTFLAGFRISISRGKENVSPRQTAGAAHRALASAAETEHRQNDAGQGFPVRRRGFCAVFDKQKILQPQRLQDFLELLPGFGPGTSSLPMVFLP